MTSHNLNSDLSVEQPLIPSISAQCNDIYKSVDLEHVSFNPLADRLEPEELNPLQQESIIPLEHDILSTRGYARNLGALRYRELILENKLLFEDGDADDKANIIEMIIEDLRPGRFLKSKRKQRSKDGDPEVKTKPSVPGVLEVMNPSAVNTKIKNAMRDCPSESDQISKLLSDLQVHRQRIMNGTINKKVNKRKSTGTTNKISKRNRNISTDSEQKTTPEMSSEYNLKRTESFEATSASKQKAALEINDGYYQSTLPKATLVPEQKTIPEIQGEHNYKTIESVRTSSKEWAYDFHYQQQVIELSEMSSDSKLHVSAEEIADFIKQMIEKGKKRRLQNSNHDSDWFNRDRQHLVRMQLLKRCYVAINSPLSLPAFFTKFSEGLFGEAYYY